MRRPSGICADFFRHWSAEMAYVLGVICADGCLVEHANGHHALNITSQDLDWLQSLRSALRAEQKIGSKSRAHQLQIRNRVLYASLLRLTLTPRKSKTLQLPAVPPAYFADFVRGYFDGDGSVRVWQEKRWRRSWQLRSTLTSGSRVFLDALRERLRQEGGLGVGSLRWGVRAYCLQYTIQDSLRLYEFMYPGAAVLCLRRKRAIFEQYRQIKTASA